MYITASGLRQAPAVIRTLAVTAALLMTGCATGSTDNPFGGGGGPDQIQIAIVNNNQQDVTVYALAPATRERLGRVGSHTSETFTMRWAHTRELRLELDFLAGPRCFSQSVVVSPGEELELVVQPSLTRLNCR